MNVLLIFLILWSFGDAKNIFDQIPGGGLCKVDYVFYREYRQKVYVTINKSPFLLYE